MASAPTPGVIWVDAQLPPALARWPRQTHDVAAWHVDEVEQLNADDPAILAAARSGRAGVVETKDDNSGEPLVEIGRRTRIAGLLGPIQEYAAAAKADVALFTPGMQLQMRTRDDRNDEFWAHQFFTGENPPTEAVIQMHFKAPMKNPMLRVLDGSGAVVRELAVPAAKNLAGIQSVCWDPLVEPVRDLAAAAGSGQGAGWWQRVPAAASCDCRVPLAVAAGGVPDGEPLCDGGWCGWWRLPLWWRCEPGADGGARHVYGGAAGGRQGGGPQAAHAGG